MMAECLLRGMCNTNYGNKDLSPLGINQWGLLDRKTSLRYGNSPITDPITKMGLAHAFELVL